MDIKATTRSQGQEHLITSGGQPLALWAKPASGVRRGSVLFIHGSSMPKIGRAHV